VLADGVEPLLKEVLSHKTASVTKQYYETIKREVRVCTCYAVTVLCLSLLQLVIKLERSLDKLTVEQFLKIYKAFLIWPPWV